MLGCVHSQNGTGCGHAYQLGVKLGMAVALKLSDYHAQCAVCKGPAVLCCLECSRVACMDHATHAHPLAVCLIGQGSLYCAECADFVVDPYFERLRAKQVRQVLAGQAANGKLANGLAAAGAKPNGSVTNNAEKLPFVAVTGIRGVYNMGATCYMAVILQSMVHNPIVRGFFLAGGHESGECQQKWCVTCCIDRLFCHFFGTAAVAGYGIADLLTATAKSDQPLMTGTTQQDAHEFLQFLLDEFHKTHFDSTTFRQATKVAGGGSSSTACRCVAHRAFGGTIESTLACDCGNETKTLEPIMDLSLELTGKDLRTCLDRFTAGEKLTHYTCSACRNTGTVTKRLMVEKLPPILQIQLKRFKHTMDGATQKIETPVQFPFQLNLTPYTTHPGDRPLLYELYGVACHQGSLDTGHYTCMMKHSSGAWYHFNDDMVTSISPQAVLSSNAYLLFYIVKHTL